MKAIQKHSQEISGKTVLVRCNFDVPIKNGRVVDTTRIKDSLQTIRFLLKLNCRLILIAHQDRPGGKYNPDNSLSPIGPILENLLNMRISFISHHRMLQAKLPDNHIILLDNLRFFPQEKGKDQQFAQHLAQLADIYVNESFATAHRDHSSITLIPQFIPGYLGISFTHEIDVLNQVIDHPKKPLVIILGGSKIKTKEPLINTFKTIADFILVGGKIALDLKDQTVKVPQNVTIAKLTQSGKDITKESAQHFSDVIKKAGTVIWNGTMGVFEEPPHHIGTKIIASSINQTSAFTLVGGGDTETALTQFNTENNISHISSGGGAMLTYLSQKSLIGLEALQHHSL